MEKIDDSTFFGLCNWCNKLVPRNCMVSSSVRVYGKGVKNTEEIIQLRMCPDCFKFDNKLYRADQIKESKELSEKCDFIEYEAKKH